MHDVRKKVRDYIVDNFIMGGDEARFADADSLMEKHIIDSTGFLELVTFLEENYAFVVEDEEMVPENLDSLDNIESYVQRKRAA
jgi:acyl carrier protein